MFVFDQPVHEAARRATAAAVSDPESGFGTVTGDEVQA